MTSLAHDRYCAEIIDQVRQLRAVVTSGADLSVRVPTCPDWTLEQLVRHTGGALRWAALMVRTRAAEEIPEEQVPAAEGPEGEGDPAALDAWLAESGELLTGALREAGPDAEVWGWAGVHDAGFWARRMTHELVVHRADATLAAGLPYTVAPEVAADAIDEWLGIVAWAERTGDPEAVELNRRRGSIHLHATDARPETAAEWLIELGGDGVVWRRAHERATVALRGPLTEVLLAFYRRRPLDGGELEILGERELLEYWLERATFG
ncbi:maleylpyruvate isomerase family mycothiol-dependent enzyme [Streptomyces sp. NPDC000983]|uniref:maleylpyruvate isomerase family mycothiol-dependent enzyme n=1 Tax=Streptomyces sp. NPDC000983 TaxID=3154373 RepID=UPI003328A0CB